MKPDNIEILDNLVAEAENKIFNKFNNRAVMPTFIRIDNCTIINVSYIVSISKGFVENTLYDDYKQTLDSLIKNVVEQYTKEHPKILDNNKSPEEISLELYNKFFPVCEKNVRDEYGEWPEPYIPVYKIFMQNDKEFMCSEEIYRQICNLIGIDMSYDFNENDL